jgi:ribonuclease I
MSWPGLERNMSARNGDKARFQKDRKRKMLRRQRIRELVPTKTPALKKPH